MNTPLTRVDPWEQQRLLMVASSQRIPSVPTVTNGAIFYGALLLEETGETAGALSKAVALCVPENDPVRRVQLSRLKYWLEDLGQMLEREAKNIRTILSELTVDLDTPLPPVIAAELFDGIIDVAVVNCGLALACGLPGAAGYAEVAISNLSKINPDTGVIDKHPDGKWIKGVDYKEPDLERVLREQQPG
jgi:hypothetical protein